MKKALVGLMILFTWVGTVAYAANSKQQTDWHSINSYTDIPGVTQEEISAIEALKKEVSGFSYGHTFETEAFMLPDDTYAGFTIEACKLLSGLFGIEFIPKYFDDWTHMRDALNSQTLDFSGGITSAVERTQTYFMTIPVAGRSLKLYAPNNGAIVTETDVNGKTIGFLKGAAVAEKVTDLYPELSFEAVYVNSYAEAVEMLKSGEIDAVISTNAAAPSFDRYDFITSKDFFSLAYYPVSVTTANPRLAPVISVIDKYLTAGGIDEFFELYQTWEFKYKKQSLLQSLTAEEKAYLEEHLAGNIKVNIGLQHDAYPASFYNEADEEFQGVALDILKEITLLTGLEFETFSTSSDTPIAIILEKLKTGEISMMTQLLKTESRKNDYIWSEVTYLTTNYALLSRIDYPNLDVYQVPWEKVGTVAKTAHEVMFDLWFPGHENRTVYATTDEAFYALERGEVDLIMLSENMLLQQTNLHEKPGFKVNIGFNKPLDSFFGFSKNEEILRSIVDKAMLHIQIDSISSGWMNRTFDYSKKLESQRATYFAVFSSALLVILAGLLFLLLRNNRLGKKLVKQQENLNDALSAARAASESKSIFLANMSHEIRTPMNAIVGFSEIALGADISSAAKDSYLIKIKDSSEILMNTINDILDISKIEADKLTLENIPFNMHDVFRTCQTIIAPKAREKGIALYCYAEPSVGKKLLGDPTRLRQVLLNLLSNAVKFTNTGMVKLLSVIEKSADNTVTMRFEVKDSGIGMSPEQIKKIFEPFVQADESTTRKYGGTGLGLTITQNIVRLMGGELEVESAPGVGSKFSFAITFNTVDQSGDIPSEQIVSFENGAPRFAGEILICEDNEINQQVLVDHLRRVGIDFVIANNGKEGVDIVSERMKNGEKPFDLIFMDMHMPVMDGLGAAAALLEIGNKTPIVALTANVMLNDREIYKERGIPDFLGKPFTSKELWTCLSKYFTPLEFETINKKEMNDIEEKERQKLLTNFVKNHRNAFNDIKAAVDAEDIKLAHRLAHTLKGLAAMMDEIPLQEASRAVENSLADGSTENLETQMNVLEHELNLVITDLLPLLDKLNEPKRDAPITLDKAKARELFEKLEPLLRDDNAACLALADELREIPETDDLILQIEDYEFETALETLEELRKLLGV